LNSQPSVTSFASSANSKAASLRPIIQGGLLPVCPSAVGLSVVFSGISPASLDFGSQEAGTGTAKQTLTITNSSNFKTLSITSLAHSSAVYQVTADSCSRQTISAGGHCTFDSGFQPIANFASVNS